MTTHEHYYERQEVIVDGHDFSYCTFTQCKLIYDGSGKVKFTKCKFKRCTWAFRGSAANTLAGLRAIIKSGDPAVAKEVRDILRRIVRP